MRDGKIPDSAVWQVLSRQTLYDFPPFLRLEKQTVRLPAGQVVNDYHWLDMPDSCLVCPLTIDRKVLILRGYRHGAGEVTSFLPGGHVDVDESPLVAAQRELLEETGYVAANCVSMGSFIPNGNYGCGRVHLFKATGVTRMRDPDEGDLEAMDIEVVDTKTVLHWIQSGRI